MSWLVSQEERWLLVLNNADDTELNLREFFPDCGHGDILITSRNQKMRAHTRDPVAFCRVLAMLPGDALKLLLEASMADDKEETRSVAATLVEVSLYSGFNHMHPY